jgi:hypothetical protein
MRGLARRPSALSVVAVGASARLAMERFARDRPLGPGLDLLERLVPLGERDELI